ncbi:MAG: hypothetical protein ACI9MR_002396 [Myxococcota bacterium]|jgi:hypothetical protein
MCATALTSKLERRCDRDERAGLGFRLPRAAFAAWLQHAVAPPERAYDADDALLADLLSPDTGPPSATDIWGPFARG